MTITENDLKEWQMKVQSEDLQDRYQDLDGVEKVKEFFFTYIYSMPEDGTSLQDRNGAFKYFAMMRFDYTFGIISKLIPNKKLREYILGFKVIMEVYRNIEGSDVFMRKYIMKNASKWNVNSIDDLTKEHFFKAYVSQPNYYDERKKQIELSMKALDYGIMLMENKSLMGSAIGFLENLENSRFKKLRIAASGTKDFIQQANDIFNNNLDDILKFKEIMVEKETAHLDYVVLYYGKN
ncbi:hypothetical protein ACFL1H_05035 [Nanoarchaeota archaeon]